MCTISHNYKDNPYLRGMGDLSFIILVSKGWCEMAVMKWGAVKIFLFAIKSMVDRSV